MHPTEIGQAAPIPLAGATPARWSQPKCLSINRKRMLLAFSNSLADTLSREPDQRRNRDCTPKSTSPLFILRRKV